MPGEFELIARHFRRPTPGALLGPGDDCALLQATAGYQLAVTTDMLVAGTHFLPTTDPRQLGWKTLAVNLSDLAAMGARPRWALLACSLPEADECWLAAFAAGFFACAQRHAVDLIGGDTTRGPLNFCVTAIGELPAERALRRDRGSPGDDLWVSGQPGMAALGLAHLQGRCLLAEPLAERCLAALHAPLPRVELGLALQERGLAGAAIDVSDGLLADLTHIVEDSAVGADVFVADLPPLPSEVDAALARTCQLSGGDDYELLFSAPPAARQQLTMLARELALPLWRCGRLSSQRGRLRLLAADGSELPTGKRGYDHFA